MRADGTDPRNPYPGLESFTEDNASFFFGREIEIDAVVKKLERLYMLVVVGPSGVGKTSFVRAGVLPFLPLGWGKMHCQPGVSPFLALGQALAPQLGGDPEAIRACFHLDEPGVAVSLLGRWRRKYREAVLVVDQFEELFAQNPPEVCRRFADLLGGLPVEADVRVLIAMRDDFLFQCHEYPALHPMFVEPTVLAQLRGPDLRRALVQPALACGYHFEDEALVDRMIAEVESERGALPLVAFAARRLWEARDRTRGVLTWRSYESVGGVAGSLAQHAEAVLERIGPDRVDLVREIFRNLVTARGTRLSRERDELLSIFQDRVVAAEVLAHLVDSRLLTSFEVSEDPQSPAVRHRIEVIHESLLSSWPRLVRWQTQDADGAQFRDQLGQAARLWEERGRPDDMLWTGTVYREFRLWRDRYPGGLTSAEESFSAAMDARAKREQRRRHTAVASAFAALLAVLGVVGALWQRSARSEQAAVAEARRAESGKLYALAQNEKVLPNALAYALGALELSDQPEYRRLALGALLRGPTAFRLPVRPESWNPWAVDFSPDGRWLVVSWSKSGGLQLYPLDGGEPRDFVGHRNWVTAAQFSEDSRLLVTAALDSSVRLWSIPDGRLLRTLGVAGAVIPFLRGKEERLLTRETSPGGQPTWRSWPLGGGEGRYLGRTVVPTTALAALADPDVDPSGSWIIQPAGSELLLYSLQDLDRRPIRVLGRHAELIAGGAVRARWGCRRQLRPPWRRSPVVDGV